MAVADFTYLGRYCSAELKGWLGELNPGRGAGGSLRHHVAGTVQMGRTC